MWSCHKCGKPVFFGKFACLFVSLYAVLIYKTWKKLIHFLILAERKQSMGYDWHPDCLKCEECGKILKPGQHAEVLIVSFSSKYL